MNDFVTVTTIGRVTADLELKTSQNGKNTKYVSFRLAVNKGFGDNSRPNFYSCVIYGEAAQRMIDAKVKKGSLIRILADQELVEYQRNGGGTGWMAKLTLHEWSYAPTNRSKEANNEENTQGSYTGFAGVENCGDNGLPFD